MRTFTRAASIVAATAAAALTFPSLASAADDIGEIKVAASATGSDLTITFTDDTAEDVDLKYCFVFVVDEEAAGAEDPRSMHVIRVHDEQWSGGTLDASNLVEIPFPEDGGEFSHTYTDLEDGEWQVVYNCAAARSTAPEEGAYWSNSDEEGMFGDGAPNREPIVIILPQEAEEPGCTGLGCLLSGSAG